jgi:uncharacterized membrane protein YbaN (DUF454 family)
VKKKLYLIAGIISTVLGIIGAFLPIMPTTPFLLLASFLFSRSSPKLNNFLLTNRFLGEYFTNYIERRPLPLSSKIKSISFLWLGLLATIFFADIPFYVIIILIFVGIGVSLHIGLLRRKRKNILDEKDNLNNSIENDNIENNSKE